MGIWHSLAIPLMYSQVGKSCVSMRNRHSVSGGRHTESENVNVGKNCEIFWARPCKCNQQSQMAPTVSRIIFNRHSVKPYSNSSPARPKYPPHHPPSPSPSTTCSTPSFFSPSLSTAPTPSLPPQPLQNPRIPRFAHVRMAPNPIRQRRLAQMPPPSLRKCKLHIIPLRSASLLQLFVPHRQHLRWDIYAFESAVVRDALEEGNAVAGAGARGWAQHAVGCGFADAVGEGFEASGDG